MLTSNPILTPDKILQKIRGNFEVNEENFQKTSVQTNNIVNQNPGLLAISTLNFLHKINHPQKHLIRRAGFISPKLLFISDKIKTLCRLNYRHAEGRIDPCGGIRKNYLACSPYSPHERKVRGIFDKADLCCLLQADTLTDMKQQKYLHEILFGVERYLMGIGAQIVISFGAGPCRICDKCAGQFNEECYEPEKMRFSLESFGVDVDWAMKMMSLKTGDNAWEIHWLKDYGLKQPEKRPFKSVAGLLLRSESNLRGG